MITAKQRDVLARFPVGQVVWQEDSAGNIINIGHVVRFAMAIDDDGFVSQDEVVLLVHWADDESNNYHCHPKSVKTLSAW
jgi:hypothetical protein